MKVPSVTGVFSAPEPRLSTLSRTCTELPERTVLCRFAHVRSAESRCEADRQGGTEVMRSGTALINGATGREVVEHSIKSSILALINTGYVANTRN
jgi:hypothetical protein